MERRDGFAVLLLLFSFPTAGQNCPPGTPPQDSLTSIHLVTDEVTEAGERKSKECTQCATAPQGSYFKSSSLNAVETWGHHNSERDCSLRMASPIEVLPGIEEPTQACLRAKVVSVGGVWNKGKRGQVACALFGQVAQIHTNNPPPSQTTPLVAKDGKGLVATVPVFLSLERERRSLISIAVPISVVEKGLNDAVPGFIRGMIEEKAKKDDFKLLRLRVDPVRFVGIEPGSRTIALRLYSEAKVRKIAEALVRCSLDLKFQIVPSSPIDPQTRNVGSASDCSTGNEFAKLANLGPILTESVDRSIKSVLHSELGKAIDTRQWAEDDPELGSFLSGALMQALYCQNGLHASICLNVAWPQPALIDRERRLVEGAPTRTRSGPVSLEASKQAAEWIAAAQQEMTEATPEGGVFPVARTASGIEDGDMMLFGGLLCLAGIADGCSGVRLSRTEDGRYWRSYLRRNQEDGPGKQATFSGDQMKGLIAYFVATRDRDGLSSFLQYLKAHPISIAVGNGEVIRGVSACPNGSPTYTCMLSGFDFFALERLANEFGIGAEFPSEWKEWSAPYAFDVNSLAWESQFSSAGYRLHLVAVQLWLLRKMGVEDSRLVPIASTLASRQPLNPFFNYLHLGAHNDVRVLADAKCRPRLPGGDRSDWSWQRTDNGPAGNGYHSMLWDCAFIYSLIQKNSTSSPRCTSFRCKIRAWWQRMRG